MSLTGARLKSGSRQGSRLFNQMYSKDRRGLPPTYSAATHDRKTGEAAGKKDPQSRQQVWQ
jgi:hypothetical protein